MGFKDVLRIIAYGALAMAVLFTIIAIMVGGKEQYKYQHCDLLLIVFGSAAVIITLDFVYGV